MKLKTEEELQPAHMLNQDQKEMVRPNKPNKWCVLDVAWPIGMHNQEQGEKLESLKEPKKWSALIQVSGGHHLLWLKLQLVEWLWHVRERKRNIMNALLSWLILKKLNGKNGYGIGRRRCT